MYWSWSGDRIAVPQRSLLSGGTLGTRRATDTPNRSIRRLVLVGIAVATLALLSCGSATATLHITVAGGSLSYVITGSDSTIQSFENAVASTVTDGQAKIPSVTATSGDQHGGALVCQTEVTDNGVGYHVAVYSTVSGFTSDVCRAIESRTGQ